MQEGSKNKFALSSVSDVQTSNIIFFSALVQPDNHVVRKFDTQLSNEVIFFALFFVCFSLYAFKIGAITAIKADRMLNFALMRSAFCCGVLQRICSDARGGDWELVKQRNKLPNFQTNYPTNRVLRRFQDKNR